MHYVMLVYNEDWRKLKEQNNTYMCAMNVTDYNVLPEENVIWRVLYYEEIQNSFRFHPRQMSK